MTLKRMFFKKTRLVAILVTIILANLGLLSILNYDKQRISALTSLKSLIQTPTDIKNKQLDSTFVQENILGTKVSSKYYIPDYLYDSTSKTYTFDPRLSIGVYLNYVAQEYKDKKSLSNFKIPFSWYDWTDLGSDLNKLINLPQRFKPDCNYVCTNYFNKELQKELEEKIKGTFTEQPEEELNQADGQALTEAQKKKKKRIRKRPSKHQNQKYSYCTDDNTEFQPGFRIFKNHLKSRPDVKKLQSKSYLYSEAQPPVSLTFITENGNIQVETLSNAKKSDKQEFGLLRNKMIQKFRDNFRKTHNKSINDEIYIDPKEELENALSIIPSQLNHSSLIDQYSLELNQSQFLFNGPEYLKQNSKSKSIHQQNFKKSIENSLNTKELLIEKYFKEVLLSHTRNHMQGGHFDWRFFSGAIDEADRHIVISRLLQNWFKLTSNAGLTSWIAHGQLLAYDYNSLSFPWDDDVDVQMPFAELAKFAELYNGSLIIEDPNVGFGRYYVDVTSSLTHRLKGNNNNHIDARFVDVDTGLFIDITALAVSSSDTSKRFQDRYEVMTQKGEELMYHDPNFVEGLYDDIDKDLMRQLTKSNPELYKQLRQFQRENSRSSGRLLSGKTPEQMFDINYKLQTYNCRNNHFVALDELSPLKRSFFEKIPIYVPNNVSAILLDEYPPQKTLTDSFQGHAYLPQIRLWVPTSNIANSVRNEDKRKNPNLLTQQDIENLLADDEATLFEYYKTFDVTLVREKEKEIMNDKRLSVEKKHELISQLIMDKSFPSLRKDLFISKLEGDSFRDQGMQFDKDAIRTIMIDQLRKEYKKEVDYSILGSGKRQEIDYNQYGRSFKEMLYKVQKENYEPDFDLKKAELEKTIEKTKSKSEKDEKQKELDKLLDAEIKANFANDAPLPEVLKKGEVESVERPRNKPMDSEDDPGIIEGVDHADTQVMEKPADLEAQRKGAKLKLPQIESDDELDESDEHRLAAMGRDRKPVE